MAKRITALSNFIDTSSDTFSFFENLPADIQKEIASYLDTRTLSFFASTNKKHLINMLPLLMQRQKRLLSTLTVGSFSMSTYYYQAQKLFVCGYNSHGQLGLGDTQNRNSFTEVKNISGKILQVVAGAGHVLVLTDQGLWSCGENNYGQLALGDHEHRSLFTKVENIPGKILQIHAGYYCTLVLTDQSLWACGDSRLLDDNKYHTKLTKVNNISGKILQIAVGMGHILVLTDEGLWTCGANNCGQLGLGHDIGVGLNKEYHTLTRVGDIPGRILQIVAGGSHTLVLTDQKLWVCGSNYYGTLGLGLEPDQNCYTLREVENIPGKILQVAASREHTVILTTEGMWVCGNNDFGQLGLGDNQKRNRLTRVKDIPGKILQISTGETHTMVLTTQGLWACGYNCHGQLGLSNYNQSNDTLTNSYLTQVKNLPEAMQKVFSLYHYMSKLEYLANSITKPQAVKPEDSGSDSLSRLI